MVHRTVLYAAYAIVGVGSGYAIHNTFGWGQRGQSPQPVDIADAIPSRAHQLSTIRKCSSAAPFDVLIIGGGATGSGCAVDAATRGYRTALVERDDFGSQTSSRSTKLVHGGVRYLEKAVWNLDFSQFKLVLEALKERKVLIDNAPHLAKPFPIITPCYKWWEVPYYWAGLKAYDLVAGTHSLVSSSLLWPSECIREFPTLAANQTNGRSLKGGVLYFDGQFNDARLNVTLACTAAAAGATVVNHMECKQLIKNADGKVVGARCQDSLSGETLDIYATVVINATGPFTDSVRQMSAPDAKPMIMPSAGSHITLPEFYCPGGVGLIIPKTKDGRVCFVLPWQGAVIAGTTDTPSGVTDKPRANDEEIAFILDAISDFLSIKVRRQDVLSTWSGIRPLAAETGTKDTSSIVRDHLVMEEPDGLLTVAGGKWTTYRLMAEDTINKAVATGRLPTPKRGCVTTTLKLLGGQQYRPATYAELAQSCGPHEHPIPQLDTRTAQHLANAYGDRAGKVLQLAGKMGLGRPLAPGHSELEAEVVYCVRNEYCETVQDFVARRSRLAFTDVRAALAAMPRIAELMGAELGWNAARQQQEIRAATQYLQACFGAPGTAGVVRASAA